MGKADSAGVRWRKTTLVFIAAVITELLLLLWVIGSSGGNAQGIWIPSGAFVIYIWAHLPAALLTDSLGVGENWFFVLSIITGVPQFFLIFWVTMAIWGWMQRGRHP